MAALGFMKKTSGAGVGNKSIGDRDQRTSSDTPYDIVIRLNSLESLKTEGWEILKGDKTRPFNPPEASSEKMYGVVVAILGSFNRGKSFLINQLCKIQLSSDNLIHTEGISIVTAKHQTRDVIFIDTAGSDAAMSKDKMNDRKATDALVKEIALHLSSTVMIVVNRLRATDQTYIQNVIKYVQNSKLNQEVMIIHNLLDVKSIDDTNKIIEKEVKGLFGATIREMAVRAGDTIQVQKFFVSKDDKLEIHHFILAQQGSPASQEWNTQSLDAIMNTLQQCRSRRDFDVINEMIIYINAKLPKIFIVGDENNDSNTEDNQSKLQVTVHREKPYIVLSQRSNMQDLTKEPYPSKIASGLVYDDAGYFIATDSINKGQWQPKYNLYETDDDVQLVVDLAGFKKGTLSTKVEEEIITIEGCRDDLKKHLHQPVIHQEQISIGQFILVIPLQCRIRQSGTKVEREEGFYKITALKKKATLELFD